MVAPHAIASDPRQSDHLTAIDVAMARRTHDTNRSAATRLSRTALDRVVAPDVAEPATSRLSVPSTDPPPGPVEPSVPRALLDAAKELPVLLSAVETHEHFGHRLLGELRLSSEAQQPYLEGHVLPNGIQVALLGRAPFSPTSTPAGHPPLQILWMEKSGGRWKFAAERGDGRAFDDGATCARCHAEAAPQFVFRIKQRLPPWGTMEPQAVPAGPPKE